MVRDVAGEKSECLGGQIKDLVSVMLGATGGLCPGCSEALQPAAWAGGWGRGMGASPWDWRDLLNLAPLTGASASSEGVQNPKPRSLWVPRDGGALALPKPGTSPAHCHLCLLGLLPTC